MEEMYQSEIYRNCQADKYQLTLNLAILRENPHITTLLGMLYHIFFFALANKTILMWYRFF